MICAIGRRFGTFGLVLVGALVLLHGCGDSGTKSDDGSVGNCGNGVVEGAEECDDGVNNSDTEPNACRTNCLNPDCGDGVADTGEDCDEQDLQYTLCEDLGFTGGTLACSTACTFDTSGCGRCGNGTIEADEECDSTDMGGETCQSQTSYQHGDLACDANCSFDTGPCHTCGNGQIEGPEPCDDGNTSSTDGCSADCLSDETCGNGYTDTAMGEACDDGVNNSDVTPDACRTDCSLPECGDNVVDPGYGEDCEGADLGGQTCAGLGQGFTGGTLACTAGCAFNTSGCTTCGDGTCEVGELAADCPADCAALAISGGMEHTCALLADGTMRCWGGNSDGQLGDGTNSDSLAPVQVVGLSDIVAISAGAGHTCAVGSNGTAWCWGSNGAGRLGDGTTTSRNQPTPVQGITTAVDIGAGLNHSCAALTDGTARCWGRNSYGQLGNNTYNNNSYVPVVVSGLTNATAISCSGEGYFSCALKNDGTVWCWGYNYHGELGDGQSHQDCGFGTDCSPVPVQVSGLTTAVSVSVGEWHACAALGNNTARCWGGGTTGQLGNGGTSDSNVPVMVAGLSTVADVSAGGFGHSCALLTDGSARCWGQNNSGQLGNGTNNQSSTPVDVWQFTGGAGISANFFNSTCAVLGNGTAWCWGRNNDGQLGTGNTTNSNVPVQVVGI